MIGQIAAPGAASADEPNPDQNRPETLATLLARPGVAQMLRLLNADGEQARLVGGAVRNALLGRAISDIDIATTALPETVMARARGAQLHVVATGIDHGTVTVIIDGIPHEVTTLRQDIDTDGRRARVRFGRDFRADALRRDFTINALSAEPDGHIHDYSSGLVDLNSQRIRFIGDPDQRIREDYLRILRFFRFSAVYGGGDLDPAGLAAVRRNGDGLALLSRERVRQEMMKLLPAEHAVPIIGAMVTDGILAAALGRAGNTMRCQAMAALEMRHGLAPDPLRRLMALALDGPNDIEPLRDALRLTNREVVRLETVAATRVETGEPALRILLYRLGPERFTDAVLMAAANTGADVTGALALPARWQPPAFVLTGKDVIALGVAKGPAVGRLLAATEAAWQQAGLPAGEDAQRQIMAATVRSGREAV